MLDNGEIYRLRTEDTAAAGFQEGSTYESDHFHHQILVFQYPRALNHAVSMLSRRPYSRKEISTRLIRLHYTEEVAELVVYKLEKENLLNDEKFCEEWVHYRLSRYYGPSLIRRELKIKGISDDTIASVMERIYLETGQDNAVTLALKVWNRIGLSDDCRKNRQKVITCLVRKGYDWDTARKACEEAENIKKART